MRSTKKTFRIIKRKGKKGLGTNTIETTEDLEYETKFQHEGTNDRQGR